MTHLPTPRSANVQLAEGVSREYLLHHLVCPISFTSEGHLRVATEPASAASALDDLGIAYACRALPELVPDGEVERMIERLVTRNDRAIEVARDTGDDDRATDVRDLANQPPVVRYVNLLVRDAYYAGASDIHLESTRSGLAVRFRVDGVLTGAAEPPAGLNQAVVSRIKLLAELDIAERRRPQDGRIRVRLEAQELDLRISTVPNMFGESVVLRLLDRGARPVRLHELGMPAGILSAVERLVARPHGMMLVTGPTGSGKTTTLYAALGLRNAQAEKIITVEDPVEYQLPGVTQVPVHRQAGVTFATALRSILRQDPDVVMVGEMRDPETAEIAVRAAMTGHLVFSTLHTSDALGALPRLLDLGVPDYLVMTTVEGVLAQRLVRRTCEDCRDEYEPAAEGVACLQRHCNVPMPTSFSRGSGCPACRGTGFRGRIGIFEFLVMTETLRETIGRRASREEVRHVAKESGMVTIEADALAKVRDGNTTVEEVLRVIQQ